MTLKSTTNSVGMRSVLNIVLTPQSYVEPMTRQDIIKIGGAIGALLSLGIVTTPLLLSLIAPESTDIRSSTILLLVLILSTTVIVTVLRCALLATVSYVALRVTGASRFVNSLGIVMAAEISTAFQQSFVAILSAVGFSRFVSNGITEAPIGLNMFFSGGSNPIRQAILNDVNIFSLWYCVIIFCGVRNIEKRSTGAALFVAQLVWCISVTVPLLVKYQAF